MTTFDDRFAEQAFSLLLDQFGEEVEYFPRHGRPRTRTGIVNRNPAQPIPGTDRASGPNIDIDFYDDDATGLVGASIDTGGDKIRVAKRPGGTPELISISEVPPDKMKGGVVKVVLA